MNKSFLFLLVSIIMCACSCQSQSTPPKSKTTKGFQKIEPANVPEAIDEEAPMPAPNSARELKAQRMMNAYSQITEAWSQNDYSKLEPFLSDYLKEESAKIKQTIAQISKTYKGERLGTTEKYKGQFHTVSSGGRGKMKLNINHMFQEKDGQFEIYQFAVREFLNGEQMQVNYPKLIDEIYNINMELDKNYTHPLPYNEQLALCEKSIECFKALNSKDVFYRADAKRTINALFKAYIRNDQPTSLITQNNDFEFYYEIEDLKFQYAIISMAEKSQFTELEAYLKKNENLWKKQSTKSINEFYRKEGKLNEYHSPHDKIMEMYKK